MHENDPFGRAFNSLSAQKHYNNEKAKVIVWESRGAHRILFPLDSFANTIDDKQFSAMFF